MKNPVKTYSFWFKVIAAALLLTLGVWICFDRSIGTTLVLGFSGAVIIIYAVIRVVPLIKTMKSRRGIALSLGEVVLDLIVGVILFYSAVKIKKDSSADFSEFMIKYYRYFMGSVFYIRGAIYFICTIFYKEETDRSKFWVHLAIMTIGAVIMAIDNLDAEMLALVIAILALICGAALAVEGGFGYGRYRKAIKDAREPKKEVEKVEKEAPGVDKPAEEDIPATPTPTPVPDNKDKPEDRPFIN